MNNLETFCDVLIVGGGTAGTIAAIQSARLGAKTVLIERTSQLGGTITNAGVCAPTSFFADERQVIAGIGWELLTMTRELGNPELKNSPLIDYRIYALLSEEMCLNAGVELHYHETLTGLNREDGAWRALTIGNMIARTIISREVIDCSGEAVAVRLAGGECVRPFPCQPGTLEFNFTGFDVAKLDAELLEERFRAAVASGTLQREDFCYTDQPFINYLKNGGGGNFQHLLDVYGGDAVAQSQADITGRQRLLRMIRFLRAQPGLEQCFLRKIDIMTGIREGWRIVGETTVTTDDYLSGRIFPDAVAWSYYFIDIHHQDGIEMKHLARGIVPTIPFSSLIPRGLDHILAAGRIISSDRGAFSALRVQASCMAMGQVVGAAAALAVQQNIPSRQINLDELRRELRRNGALVPHIW